ncbi:hypothetical protein HK096_008767 [Nowakowskiella sp. JEL0078]|nr:hypothetical protein HK096_008767 [Nowakowskiella sp. JEL0078]
MDINHFNKVEVSDLGSQSVYAIHGAGDCAEVLPPELVSLSLEYPLRVSPLTSPPISPLLHSSSSKFQHSDTDAGNDFYFKANSSIPANNKPFGPFVYLEGNSCLKCQQKSTLCTFERLKKILNKNTKKSANEPKLRKKTSLKKLQSKRCTSPLRAIQAPNPLSETPYIVNCNSSPHQLEPMKPKSVINKLVYPTSIMDQLIFDYFPSTYWPMNVVHPRFFIDSRYSRPRSLLYAICCASCRLYNEGEFFNEAGRKMAEEFFNLSLENLDKRESTLDYICVIIILIDFAISIGDVRNVFKLVFLANEFSQDHMLHIDPDIEILEERKKWNLIEKETFRRVFWTLREIIVVFDSPQTTTKVPLCDSAFYSLPNAFRDLPAAFFHLRTNPDDFKTKFHCEQNILLGRIQTNIALAVHTSLDNLDRHHEASHGPIKSTFINGLFSKVVEIATISTTIHAFAIKSFSKHERQL